MIGMVRSWAVRLALAFVMLVGSVLQSQAAWDTNITDIVTDATTFFGNIKTLVISVVVFGIAIGIAKLIKKK